MGRWSVVDAVNDVEAGAGASLATGAASALRWLARLRLAPPSERALREAFADLQHEVSGAPSDRAAFVCHATGAIGVLRAAAGAIVAEICAPEIGVWLTIVAGCLFAVGPLPVLLTGGLGDLMAGDLPNVRAQALVTLCRAAAYMLPAAVFVSLVLMPRDLRAPIGGLAVCLAAGALTVRCIVLPWAEYRYVAFGLLGRAMPVSPVPLWLDALALGARTLTALLLADRIRIDPRRHFYLGLTLFVVLAFSMRPSSTFLVHPSPYAGRFLEGWLSAPMPWRPFSAVLRLLAFVITAFPLPLIGMAMWLGIVRGQERGRAATGAWL